MEEEYTVESEKHLKEWEKPKDALFMAKTMGKNRLAAARIRIRYLEEQITVYMKCGGDVAKLWTLEAVQEIQDLSRLAQRTPNERRTSNRIDDTMIAMAKNYPVDRLIAFDRWGKSMAWCHEDSKPSLSHWKKGNKARCFVCSETFSSIDVLMKRDGHSFLSAVRALQT